MKTLKKTCSILSMLSLMLCCIVTISCSDDDDDSGSLTGGYWMPKTELYNTAVESIENDWMDDNGYMGGYRAYRFTNKNTVEVLAVCIYGKSKNPSFYQESILGRTIYYVAEDITTYTYAIKDNKIIITNGDICTKSGNEFRVDGVSYVYSKLNK